MRIILWLSTFFIVTACNMAQSEDACRDTLSGIGILISERDREENEVTLDVTINFQKSIEALPLFAYLTYDDKRESLLKVPVFMGRPKDTDNIHYSILTSLKSLEYLIFETFYYLSGGKGKYLFVSGFSDPDGLKCAYMEI